jgi:uroporphyrinogen-III synthase
MPTLKGARVALLEARMTEEVAALVRRLGGVPYSVPAVREAPRLEQVAPFLDELTVGTFSLVIFSTGASAAALFRGADALGRLDATLAALRATTIACRGPKPLAVLRRHNVPVQIVPVEPYTTSEMLTALATFDVAGKQVALAHYGEPNEPLARALTSRGATLNNLSLYQWVMPDDIEPLKTLVDDFIERRVDAVAFTSQVQCRHLFEVAESLGKTGALADALNTGTIVAAVGPVCAAALITLGVTPDVIPPHPRMGPMITALAEYLELTEGLRDEQR